MRSAAAEYPSSPCYGSSCACGALNHSPAPDHQLMRCFDIAVDDQSTRKSRVLGFDPTRRRKPISTENCSSRVLAVVRIMTAPLFSEHGLVKLVAFRGDQARKIA